MRLILFGRAVQPAVLRHGAQDREHVRVVHVPESEGSAARIHQHRLAHRVRHALGKDVHGTALHLVLVCPCKPMGTLEPQEQKAIASFGIYAHHAPVATRQLHGADVSGALKGEILEAVARRQRVPLPAVPHSGRLVHNLFELLLVRWPHVARGPMLVAERRYKVAHLIEVDHTAHGARTNAAACAEVLTKVANTLRALWPCPRRLYAPFALIHFINCPVFANARALALTPYALGCTGW